MKLVIVGVGAALLLLGGGTVLVYRFMPIVVVGIWALIGIIVYDNYLTAPSCDSSDVTFAVTYSLAAKLPDSSGTLRTANIRALKGGLFASRRECVMDVAPTFQTNPSSGSQWLRVRYSTINSQSEKDQVQDVHVVGPVKQAAAGP